MVNGWLEQALRTPDKAVERLKKSSNSTNRWTMEKFPVRVIAVMEYNWTEWITAKREEKAEEEDWGTRPTKTTTHTRIINKCEEWAAAVRTRGSKWKLVLENQVECKHWTRNN